ncbi:MAG: hypothetical protein H6916_07870 [Novosphingobium sp.]|uniref:hypothetical protein n=1 Tax=Novosphingobium sp. TaxID=1874826 RepID=UPI0026154B12|nr:hypothetical protein [Novosphingobium sp.]MCP5386721.1 hypothetical protein [Novosphingobium sp.]
MERVNAFMIFWLGGVSVMGLVSLAFGIRELRSGYARWGWQGNKIERAEEPFYYWMIVTGRFAGVIVTGFMFWFGLGMMGDFK